MDIHDKFQILRTATDLTFPRWGAWLYDTWQAHNTAYFDSHLAVIPLYFGILPHGAKLGLYHSGEYPRISIHISLLEPAKNANPWQILPLLGERFASDVLLHEMVHQAIYERYGHNGSELDNFSGATSHNNTAWCAEITRLAPMIGLGSIKAQPVKRSRLDNATTGKKGNPTWQAAPGYLDREQLATFPHCLTNEAYYHNGDASRL